MLELKSFTVFRNNTELFSPITISLSCGQCLELSGTNGSGKSTLLRTLTGLHSQYAGYYLCADYLYQGHRLGLDETMTPVENLDWFVGMEGSTLEKPRLQETLERVDMLDLAHTPCLRMSQGQKRRVSVARWILSKRAVWILDEPFSHLDYRGVDLVNAVIKEKCLSGGIVVCATHVALEHEKKIEWTLTAFDGLAR